MPVVHFQVELAVPAIAAESGLLRRHGAGALYGGEVLREDDAALQFPGARIGRAGEIDRRARSPECGPMLFGGGKRGGRIAGGVSRGAEGTAEDEAIAGGSQYEAVSGFLFDGGWNAGP